MIKTKERIILKAIELFNIDGFSNVSLHKIAETLHLSPGNLTYHFPKKDDLMNAVYLYFQEEIEKVSPHQDITTTLLEMDCQMELFYHFQQRFRFFYLDLIEIGRAFPLIAKEHYLHIERQIIRIYNVLNYNMTIGKLHSYQTMDHYHALAKQIWMTSVYWLSQSIVRGVADKVANLKDTIWYLIYPHLSDEGKIELSTFANKSIFSNSQIHINTQ